MKGMLKSLLNVNVHVSCFRPLDGFLLMGIELALIAIYVCMIVIKACETSREVCSTFGLGETSKGEA